jgi:hypothetical protein
MGAMFSAPVKTDPGAHPASYTISTGVFPEVTRPESGVDGPPHVAPRLNAIYLYQTSGPSLAVIG